MKRGRAVKCVSQRHLADCGTACLAMLLEIPYGDAAAAVRAVLGDGYQESGTEAPDLQRAARRLGVRLRSVRRKREYLDGQTGILGVMPDGDASDLYPSGHWCILKAGVIIDTDAVVWPSASDYFRLKRAKPTTLLVKAE